MAVGQTYTFLLLAVNLAKEQPLYAFCHSSQKSNLSGSRETTGQTTFDETGKG